MVSLHDCRTLRRDPVATHWGYLLTKCPLRISIPAALTCAVFSVAVLALLTAYVRFRMRWQDAYFTYDAFDPIVIYTSIVIFACVVGTPLAVSPATRARLHSIAGRLPWDLPCASPLDCRSATVWPHRAISSGYSRHPLQATAAFALSAMTTAAIRATPFLRRVV